MNTQFKTQTNPQPCFMIIKQKVSPIKTEIIFSGFQENTDYAQQFLNPAYRFIYQVGIWFCDTPSSLLFEDKAEMERFLVADWEENLPKKRKKNSLR